MFSDPSFYRSIDLQIHGFTDPLIYRSIDLQIHRLTDPSFRSTEPPIYRSVDLQIQRSTDPPIYRSVDLQIHRSTDPSIYRSVDLLIHQSWNEVFNFSSRLEKSLNSNKVLEKYLISLYGLEKSLKVTTLSPHHHFLWN